MSDQKLSGKRVAVLTANEGIEQIELTQPWSAIEQNGGVAELVAPEPGVAHAFHHLDRADVFEVETSTRVAEAKDYDALVLPGGVANPDALRQDEHAVQLVRDFFAEGKPVAAICHAPWMLVEAGVIEDRKLTSWPSLKTDIENAGGNWVDEAVVVDQGLTTSRKPDDLDAFCSKMVEEICEGVHPRQAASV